MTLLRLSPLRGTLRWSPFGGTAPGLLLIAFALSIASPLSADPGPFVARVHQPHDGNVSALAWDGETSPRRGTSGTLWAGTFDAGLARLRDGRWERVPIPGTPKQRWINALCWDGETLWIGSGGGLARWDAASRSLERLDVLDGPVNSIRHEFGTVVVAGNDRVWIRRGDTWDEVELPGEALHAAFIRDGTLWTGGMWGALERRAEDWRRYSEMNGRLPHSWVTALLPVGDTVWAGTYDAGLVVLAGDDPARVLRPGAWVNFNALTRTRDGVAVGTMGDGLLLWNRSNRSWRRLTTADGLPSDDVTAIVEAGDNVPPEGGQRYTLWVGTRGGVAEVRTANTTPPGGLPIPQSPPQDGEATR